MRRASNAYFSDLADIVSRAVAGSKRRCCRVIRFSHANRRSAAACQ
jgi:hypothetical protein